jgi:hypothetical protein
MALADEGRSDDVQRMNPSERVAMTWQLALQAWMFKDGLIDEPRLCRDVVRTLRTRALSSSSSARTARRAPRGISTSGFGRRRERRTRSRGPAPVRRAAARPDESRPAVADVVFQVGLVPSRIDLLTSMTDHRSGAGKRARVPADPAWPA